MQTISTKYGVLVPQYDDGTARRKNIKAVTFYGNGNIRSIALHQQTKIPTPIGIFPAELLTFYENGRLKRLFPLNGKISAYWTERDEYSLAVELDFSFEFGEFKKKVMAIYFYESGSVKGLTFWPNDSVCIQSPIGEVDARIGITVYPNGRLKSFEPNQPVPVKTPIGEIVAYNPETIGIHGDTNSLVFYEDGKIKSLMTANNLIIVMDKSGDRIIQGPKLKPSLMNEKQMQVSPLQLAFSEGQVRIGNRVMGKYEVKSHSFFIEYVPTLFGPPCGECSCCDSCG